MLAFHNNFRFPKEINPSSEILRKVSTDYALITGKPEVEVADLLLGRAKGERKANDFRSH